MKKQSRVIIVSLLLLLAGLFILPMNTQAASKAVKVKSKHYYTKDSKQYSKIWGLDKNGKVVWTYKTKKRVATELMSSKCVVRKNRVYIFDGNTIRVVKKSNGKKVWSTKKGVAGGYTIKFDSKDNLYAIGYYENVLVKINKNGKRMWKRSLDNYGPYWPYKISVGKKNVKVTFEMSISDTSSSSKHFVSVNAKTGKVVAYCK